MSISTETFILRSSPTSPFVRKVRMVIDVLHLTDRVTHVGTDASDLTLREQNPLGKYPCLVRSDGSAIFDSSVILEFLQWVAGTERLLPASGEQRIAMLSQTRLADGIIDAGALIIYEERYHDASMRSQEWLEHQRGKIRRALAVFEASPPDPRQTDAVSIGLACALGFLDRRKAVEWRAAFPGLSLWLSSFAESEPAFERTQPPGL
ncbi:glutathione S-transferase [Acidovorax soli]|uniref:Glutathione S-transferase n=1 Tax=Acidovorax soli TaxID=592050 RepID=A0A7X0U6V5_9BURK|nr:glutathione S-transferase N-terminal domain-containing protein [Acidovorax soli]MBB6557507.1 glutathione S-transferase [Acidovorax soli]